MPPLPENESLCGCKGNQERDGSRAGCQPPHPPEGKTEKWFETGSSTALWAASESHETTSTHFRNSKACSVRSCRALAFLVTEHPVVAPLLTTGQAEKMKRYGSGEHNDQMRLD
ncbi:uncharacterized protein LOC127859667 [Dreissena polymorpha]|uniref:uncharacterized protein LOC127859667 n=1 Tax=Dreissena polymorpha TaxID=45954 RepID=UPI002264A26F|nr:uncharacterized protein LOC127859667 [Dreissena polymorpha]